MKEINSIFVSMRLIEKELNFLFKEDLEKFINYELIRNIVKFIVDYLEELLIEYKKEIENIK